MSLFKRHWMFDCEIVLAQTWSAFAIRHGSHLDVAVGIDVVPHVNRLGPVFLVNDNMPTHILLTMNHCTVDLDQMLHTNA